jgi:glycosyltransferase involved in cell wall biosynthesis
MRERDTLERDWDVVVATSMVDLSALVGLVPALSDARLVVYFHENQLAYPTRDGKLDVQLGMMDLYAALAADTVVFNSEYNRTSMLRGVRQMMDLLPDYTPSEAIDAVSEGSTVIPVGLEDEWFAGPAAGRKDDGPLTIVWNHRWEYDKAPGRFFEALRQLAHRDVDFEVHVMGQQFRNAPEAFERAESELGDRIRTFGFVEDVERYRSILCESDVVVSTALHEFQGLAVLEAVACGCTPVVPDRLAYRDFLPPGCRFPGHPDDGPAEARSLADHLTELAKSSSTAHEATADLEWLRWANLADAYRRALLG